MTTFKPLLAETCDDITKLRYPVLVSPKLDGIRCVKVGGRALTRNLKPIKNDFVRNWVEANLPDGIDGELTMQDPTRPFAEVSSAIMSKDGQPDFVFRAFDLTTGTGDDRPFRKRLDDLQVWLESFEDPDLYLWSHFEVLDQWLCMDAAQLQNHIDSNTAMGYEGSMVRDPDGRYKHGRSTLKEGTLLKVKAFADEEATVVGVEEEMENTNEAKRDEIGRTKRSTAQAGKVGKGRLGALACRTADGAEFSIGSGFDDEQRVRLWKNEFIHEDCERVVGRAVKFKYQPPPGGRRPGEAPRFPVFLGFRDESDA